MSVTASLGAFAAIASLTALARRSLRGADSGSVAPTGVAGADALMNGGLPKAGLVELLVSSEEACAVRLMEGAVAHLGDALWILADRGARPAARDCIAAGVDLAGQLLVTPPSGREAFEAAEAASKASRLRRTALRCAALRSPRRTSESSSPRSARRRWSARPPAGGCASCSRPPRAERFACARSAGPQRRAKRFCIERTSLRRGAPRPSPRLRAFPPTPRSSRSFRAAPCPRPRSDLSPPGEPR